MLADLSLSSQSHGKGDGERDREKERERETKREREREGGGGRERYRRHSMYVIFICHLHLDDFRSAVNVSTKSSHVQSLIHGLGVWERHRGTDT